MADVTDATFMTDVLDRSQTVPVVIDLWAPWCGPCKTLTPTLEKVIGETDGMVELAKVNVDENPEVSRAFKVQSIPAVYAMRNGQVVDGFMGAVGESEVVAFVQRLLDAEANAVVDPDSETSDESGDGTTQAQPGPSDAAAATDAPASPGAPPTAGEPSLATAGSGPRLVDAPGNTAPATESASPPVSEAEITEIESELETLLTQVKSDDASRERYLTLLDRLGNDYPETNTWRRRLATALF